MTITTHRKSKWNKISTSDEDTVTEATRIIRAIKMHLQEERCNHSLREIVEEALVTFPAEGK